MGTRFRLAAVTVVAASLSAGVGHASDFDLQPGLSLSEEYNDNVYGTADGRRTDFITRVQPGMRLHYLAPHLDLNSAYIFDYRNYAKGTHGDEQIHNVDVKGTAQLFENTLFLDFGDALHRTTVDVSRDVATESLLVEQTMQNIAYASPYLLWRPGAKATVKVGYRYTDTRYFEGAGFDKKEQVGFVNLEHGVSEKLILSAGYAFTNADTEFIDYKRHDLSAGFRYGFTPTSSIFGSVGNSWNRFTGGIDTTDFFWDAGINHDFGLAVALFKTTVQNVEDPLSVSTRQVSYTGRLDRAFDRGGLGISGSYMEYYKTQTDELDQRRTTFTVSGRYEITPKVSFSGSVYGEKFKFATSDDYPYRLTANGTISYVFYKNENLLSLAYTFVTDRRHLNTASGEKLTNRVLVEARVAF